MDSRYNPSPKRKRGLIPPIATIPPTPPTSSPPHMQLDTSFSSTSTTITDDDQKSGSPRTKVAYNLQSLQLSDNRFVLDPERMVKFAGVNANEEAESQEDGEVARKRVKTHIHTHTNHAHKREKKQEIPETPDVRKIAKPRPREKSKDKKALVFVPALDSDFRERMRQAVTGIEVDPEKIRGKHVVRVKDEKLGGHAMGINRLGDSQAKSKGRKRSGTPPLSGSMDVEEGEETTIVDPERAALTWHDDEITGHDPDDPDDDGEGINGIGFKPTTAEAYARSQKRKQQMLEYRNREAKEARAKRSQRRRGSDLDKDQELKEEAENARRVRFMEKMTTIISES